MEKRKKEYKMLIGKKEMYNVVISTKNSIGMNEYTETITVDKDSKRYTIVRDYKDGFLYRKAMFLTLKDEYGFSKEMHYMNMWFNRYNGTVTRYSGIEQM